MATPKSSICKDFSAIRLSGDRRPDFRVSLPITGHGAAVARVNRSPKVSAVALSKRRESNSADDGFSTYVLPELEVLMRVARSITGNPTDADDLVQDTLLRAYKAIDRFDGRYPRAWLLTIMRNAQINRVRRKRPELMRDPDVTLAIVANTDSDAKTPESSVLDLTFDAAIENSLNGLPPQFREAIHLVDIDGLSYNEAASVLDVPVGTIMSRLHRGRKLIRNDLTLDPEFDRSPS